MAGKLITLESTDRKQLRVAANTLVTQLRSEGVATEYFEFPQTKHSASYFVNSFEAGHYNNPSPYVASMFYALDRFDAATKLKQYLVEGKVVICAGYIGSTLAVLGTRISDAALRRGYYIWADSLESGTFAVPRPTVSIVISETPATLPELCQLFPKDYVLLTDTTKLRDALTPLLPLPAAKLSPQNTRQALPEAPSDSPQKSSWYQVLQSLNSRQAPEVTKLLNTYDKVEGLSKSQEKIFTQGMARLGAQRKSLVKRVPIAEREMLDTMLSPLARSVQALGLGAPHISRHPNSVYQALLHEYVPPAYSSEGQIVQLHKASPRNELAVLDDILFETADLNMHEIEGVVYKLDYQVKSKMLEAYVADVHAGKRRGQALARIRYATTIVANYSDFVALKSALWSIRLIIQEPSPRFGFAVPDEFDRFTPEIEAYFDEALALHSTLSNSLAAPFCVLMGHKGRAQITLDVFAAWKLLSADFSAASPSLQKAASALQQAIRESHPILMGGV